MSEGKKEPETAKPAPTRTRRQYTTEQKLALLDEADQPGQSIALVARKHGISPSVMFRWRQLREQGAATGLKADEELVPASEMRAARAKIRELQRLLGKKTEENEILQEALEVAREKKLISRLPSLPKGGGK
jgi:transposase